MSSRHGFSIVSIFGSQIRADNLRIFTPPMAVLGDFRTGVQDDDPARNW
jgi:hypothetical protein